MTGREKKEENDLFFVCSLIEYLGRKTKNHRSVIVHSLGKKCISHLLELADIYHSENIEKLSEELIEKYMIGQGNFDNVSLCRYALPTFWDIGKVYKRFAAMISEQEKIPFADAVIKACDSPVAKKIDDYNNSMYYENPDYIFQSHLAGTPL